MRINAKMWTGISSAIALLAAGLIAGCPAPEPPADNVQDVVDADNFVLEAGATRTVEEDLTIRASGIVMIDGDLLVDQDRGQSITIEAEGDIVVSGRIVAGNANPNTETARSLRSQTNASRTGGNVSIESKNGSIILMDTAQITAGDGADGSLNEDGMTGGAGGRGGDVILTAPNGSLTLPNANGVIHLGNGGRGADVEFTDARLDPATLPENFDNLGGRSGVPIINVAVVEGIEPETITLEQELIDVRGQRVGGPGDEITALDLTLAPNPFAGGIGGDSGDITIELAESLTTAKRRNRSMEDSAFELDVQGGDGAQGWFSGGKGGNARAVGSDGKQAGADGGDVRALAGDGGGCGLMGAVTVTFTLTFVECAGGAGGSAFARGGNGADGAPGQDGGNGGGAIARAGGSPAIITIAGTRCGNATAIGGLGGNGGTGCDITDEGGNGGLGGDADAQGPFGILKCPDRVARLRATGSEGGDGGDDEDDPGTGGKGGTAETNVALAETVGQETLTDGQDGTDGQGCPPANDNANDNDNGNNNGGGNDTGNMNDNRNDNGGDPVETPTLEKIFTMTVIALPSSGTTNDCTVGSALIDFFNFTVPDDASKVFVAVTGQDGSSRVNVQVEHVPDRGSTDEIINICGSNQDSNTTSFNFVPENKGRWLIAIADAALLSSEYEICIQVER